MTAATDRRHLDAVQAYYQTARAVRPIRALCDESYLHDPENGRAGDYLGARGEDVAMLAKSARQRLIDLQLRYLRCRVQEVEELMADVEALLVAITVLSACLDPDEGVVWEYKPDQEEVLAATMRLAAMMDGRIGEVDPHEAERVQMRLEKEQTDDEA